MGANRRQFLTSTSTLALGGLSGLTLGGLAGTMPPDSPRDLLPTGADLGTLYDDVAKLAASHDYPLSFLNHDFDDWVAFRQQAREKIFQLLLYRPQPVDPRPEVIEQVDRGDYVQEKLVFSTSRFFRVPAYILIPKGLKAPAPAIVDLHSHGGMFLFGKEKVIDLGDNHPVMVEYHQENYDGRPTATALVRRGYVVMVIDAFMFGERRLMLDADLQHGWDRSRYSRELVMQLNARCRAKESTITKALVFAGLSWPGIVVWDDIRTVDYLVTRPEVDPQRIGCLGISMGGYRAAYLAGLDERIAAACVVGFMSTVKPMIKAHLDTHSFVHFLPGLHACMDLPDIASLMAPRPLFVQQCSRDSLFPLEGMKESVAKIAAVYRKAGAEGQFLAKFYDRPHIFSRDMQDEAFAWLDRHLQG